MLCGGKPQTEERFISQKIDEKLKNDGKKLAKVQQLLLLGTGESGKTTIIKQMKILHINGFSETEKLEKVPYIKQNIHESIYTLVSSMKEIAPPTSFHREESQKSAELILGIGPDNQNFSEEYYKHVKILWDDPGIKATFKRSNEFQLIDSASHFLDRIDEIKKPTYMPTVLDVLYCRITTTSISKIEFKIKYKNELDVEFWMYDVGGQRGQRKKWISVFEGIRAILFLVAASDFDQTLREDGKTNRLREGFNVFADIFWSRFVRTAGKIVFLNKQDLLKKKINNGQRLENYFPEFKNYKPAERIEKDLLYTKAKLFMRDKLIHISQNKPGPETIEIMPDVRVKQQVQSQLVFIHFTVATDTNNIKLVFDDVKDTILSINLIQTGLV